MDNIDNNLLRYFGGVENNSLTDVLNFDLDSTYNENHNEPNIIDHSLHYEFNDLMCVFNKTKKSFGILSINAQSINAKIDQLRFFIERIKTLGHKFSAKCIQESWLAGDSDTSQLQLNGYQMIPQGWYSSTKGGLIIYLHEQYDYIYKNKLNGYESWEGQVIQIKKVTLNKAINLVNLYRHPNNILEKCNICIREISPLLKTLEISKNEAIIAGDFNIDL